MRRTNAPLTNLVRTALVSTTLGFAACHSPATATLPLYQQQVALANRQAQQSLAPVTPRPANNQLAVLQTGTRSDVPSGILQPGTIILRRTSTVEKPIPPEQLAATVRRIASETAASTAAQTASHVAGQTVERERPLILAAADARITSVAGSLEAARQAEQAATASRLESLQAGASQTAEQLKDLAGRTDLQLAAIKDYTQQGTHIAELKATQAAEHTARNVAAQAEGRAKALVVTELSQRQKDLETRLAELKDSQGLLAQSGRDYARAEALTAQLEAQKVAIAQAQASAQQAREFAASQLALAETKRNFAEQETNRQLAEIKAAQLAQAELTRQATTAVAESLKIYADQQIASLQSETQRSIEATAKMGQLTTDSLATQTAFRLAQYRAEATNRAEQTATTLSNRFNKQLAAAVKQTEDKALKPDQVLTLARTAVQDATPQLRAIALQSLADSQDYIRTVAQESLTDEADPKVQEALQQAARNVITKDDQVVFAIRQALITPVSATQTAAAPRTVLGNGYTDGILQPPTVLGADVTIDPARLLVAPIGGFGVEPAAGGVEDKPVGHLASLNPRQVSMGNPRYRQDWLDLRKYRVVVHDDSRTLENMLDVLMAEAEPFVGPWKIKWKISPENQDLLTERFSLDAETTFADFVTYISQYVLNERGVKLSFNLFDAERILVVSD